MLRFPIPAHQDLFAIFSIQIYKKLIQKRKTRRRVECVLHEEIGERGEKGGEGFWGSVEMDEEI